MSRGSRYVIGPMRAESAGGLRERTIGEKVSAYAGVLGELVKYGIEQLAERREREKQRQQERQIAGYLASIRASGRSFTNDDKGSQIKVNRKDNKLEIEAWREHSNQISEESRVMARWSPVTGLLTSVEVTVHSTSDIYSAPSYFGMGSAPASKETLQNMPRASAVAELGHLANLLAT